MRLDRVQGIMAEVTIFQQSQERRSHAQKWMTLKKVDGSLRNTYPLVIFQMAMQNPPLLHGDVPAILRMKIDLLAWILYSPITISPAIILFASCIPLHPNDIPMKSPSESLLVQSWFNQTQHQVAVAPGVDPQVAPALLPTAEASCHRRHSSHSPSGPWGMVSLLSWMGL